ncbi:IS66-like element accessory protein TnpA, partial [Sinorhizobium meliloti]|uniref:IS66-like element accessory protein TnpA n=1 Tax=Rhizobium meliloti TaxID=382 RepID=UPI001F421C7F
VRLAFRHVANHEDNDVSIRDLEILAGSVRRRKFTRVDKEAIVSETLNGDTSVSDVARRHEIDRSLVYRWRREFGVVENAGARMGFVPVKVATPDFPEGCTARLQPCRIEIDVGHGRSVRVGVGFDQATLSRVLEVLQRSRAL